MLGIPQNRHEIRKAISLKRKEAKNEAKLSKEMEVKFNFLKNWKDSSSFPSEVTDKVFKIALKRIFKQKPRTRSGKTISFERELLAIVRSQVGAHVRELL
jgi:hypothetical protein